MTKEKINVKVDFDTFFLCLWIFLLCASVQEAASDIIDAIHTISCPACHMEHIEEDH